jgi:predicted acyltransferase
MSMRNSVRLQSLDVFRGATIAAMIIVNSLGSRESAYPQLLHAQWNGWTFADTIYPAFLFIVGISLTLSTAGRLRGGTDRTSLMVHALRRALLLFAAGLFIDLLIFPVREFPYFTFQEHLLIPGVLQKIAFCYILAFLIFLWTGWWGVVAATLGLVISYLGLLYLYPVPGCGAGVLTPECSFPSLVNKLVLDGYTSGAVYEPDGVGTWMSAVTSVLFGVIAGGILRLEGGYRRWMKWLLVYGLGLIFIGQLLSWWVPFNKPLWTPSYAAFMAGLSAVVFAACYWAVDVLQAGRWLTPLRILGLNPIAAYLASRPVDHALRVHVAGLSIPDILMLATSPPVASLLFGIIVLLVVFLGTVLMYNRRLFLKF